MTINELREKRNQDWNAAKAFVETKRDKDGLLSDEDSATYAQMEKKVQDYGAEIERIQRSDQPVPLSAYSWADGHYRPVSHLR